MRYVAVVESLIGLGLVSAMYFRVVDGSMAFGLLGACFGLMCTRLWSAGTIVRLEEYQHERSLWMRWTTLDSEPAPPNHCHILARHSYKILPLTILVVMLLLFHSEISFVATFVPVFVMTLSGAELFLRRRYALRQ